MQRLSLPKGHIQTVCNADGDILAYRAVISHPYAQTKSGSPKRPSAQFAVGNGTTRARAQKDARDWLDEMRLSFREGRGLQSKIAVSLSDATDAWLKKIAVESITGRGKLRQSSLDYYDFIARCYIKDPPPDVIDIGSLKLSVLTHTIVEDWKDDLILHVSRSAAQRALMTLKQILRFSIPTFGLALNPATEVKLGAEKNRDGSISIVLQREHVQTMLSVGKRFYDEGWADVLPSTRLEKSNAHQHKRMMAYFYPFFQLSIFSGARTGEVLGAKVKDFDFTDDTFFVRRTVDRNGELGPPKTKRGVRLLAIDPRPMRLVQTRIDTLGLSRDDLVFGTRTGKPSTGANLYRTWKRFLTLVDPHLKEDIPPLILPDGSAITGPYHTRHYHASELLLQGVSIADVSERLGHADTVITQKHYIHLLGDRRLASRNASNRFAEIFSKVV